MICVTTVSGAGGTAYGYRLGGHEVVFSDKVNTLRAFEVGSLEYGSTETESVMSNLKEYSEVTGSRSFGFHTGGEPHYEGLAPFAGSAKTITAWRDNDNYQIDVDGEPACWVSLGQQHVHLLRDEPLDERLNIELITGPGLMLIMSKLQTYTLHAGAIASSDGAVGFMAESGTGKSTLTADASPGWQQLADDMLPLSISSDRDACLVHDYPQLKLADSRAPHAIKQGLHLRALVRLSQHVVEDISIRRLTKTEAMLQIIRHTVATKLFNTETMHRHAQFAQQLSDRVPVIEVAYPRELSELNTLRAVIMAQIERL